MNNLIDIADQFKPQGKVIDIQEFGNGNINNTFLVTLDAQSEKHFILQRINTQVFRQPELVMQNMSILTKHVRDRLQRFPLISIRKMPATNSIPPTPLIKGSQCGLGVSPSKAPGVGKGGSIIPKFKGNDISNRRWEVPRVLLTRDARNHWIDPDGSFWRAISFIETAQSFDTIPDSDRAYEVGYALGMFHNLISDLPPEKLADTLEGFHITPSYLQHYEKVEAQRIVSIKQAKEVEYCLQFVRDRKTWAHVLENAKTEGHLQLRPIHGDPKVNNVMFDTATEQAIGIIDLDTVKPGLIHYDIGDCLRSGCNPLGEETEQWKMVRFDTDICQSVLKGYLAVAKDFLTQSDYDYLYDAIRLIAFELGLRFFTDYLEGNVYFKTKYPEHNLNRAIVQFKLTESIESQEASIRAIIEEIR